MRVVIGDRFRRWSSSSIAFRRWVTGILLVTHDSSVRPSPHSPRNRRQFLAREASAAVGGFVHPHITRTWVRGKPAPEAASTRRFGDKPSTGNTLTFTSGSAAKTCRTGKPIRVSGFHGRNRTRRQ